MSKHERVEIIKAGACAIGFYGRTLGKRITVEIEVARQVRTANSSIRRAQEAGFQISGSQARIIDSTDQVASAYARTDFSDRESTRQFAESDKNLCVGTQSVPTAIRRFELIRDSSIVLRDRARAIEKETRSEVGSFLKALVMGRDDDY